MKQIRGRKALVTGAATGIGYRIAQQLGRRGVDLWLVDRDRAALARASQSLQDLGTEVIAESMDLTESGVIERAIERIGQHWGELHILVNNAGIGYYGPTRDMTVEQWDQILALNLHAPIRLIRSLLPLLEQQPSSHVANICSMFGLVTYRNQAAYQTTKFALVGLTQSLRIEYAGTGLGFSAICPGFVRDTEFFNTMYTPPGCGPRTPPRWIACVPQAVARRTIDAICRNRGIVIMTPLGRWAWFAHRLFPRFNDWLQYLGYGLGQRYRHGIRRTAQGR